MAASDDNVEEISPANINGFRHCDLVIFDNFVNLCTPKINDFGTYNLHELPFRKLYNRHTSKLRI